ncbi:helix-turn-helix domain-containing protein [Nonomuraea endophytica]|uniref:helix-turn-helix domain-containing protein n=1 Tax=Nonomuraea endophytica TaxID=714136 RepID=UPI0037CAAA7C
MKIEKRKRITGAEREQLTADVAARYAAGGSVRGIALSIGRSYGFVHRLLVEGGVALRGRGGDFRKARAVEPTGGA